LLELTQNADVANELAENERRQNGWTQLSARLNQISTWLTDSPDWPPEGRKARVELNPQDRDRLRRAMLEEVLAIADREKPLPLDSRLSIGLLAETAVRGAVAFVYAETGRAAKGIPHLERALAINNYLSSPASGMPADAKWLMPATIAMVRVHLLDFHERAGLYESIDDQLVETEQALAKWHSEIRGERQALTGIRGALLARRGEFAVGERLLLERYTALTRMDNAEREFLQGERVTTLRRLINLYAAWGRPDEAAKFRVHFVDWRERAGAIGSINEEFAETEQTLAESHREIPGAHEALAGIRGAVLGRSGEFAAGEKLLLERHAALTMPDHPAKEFLQSERVATVLRLVNLYTAWGRPKEAAKWVSQLPPGMTTLRVKSLSELTQTCAAQRDQLAALGAASKLRDLGWDPPDDAYDAACALALCIPIVEKDEKASKEDRAKQLQFYGDQAMAMLRDAVAKGYKDAAHMKKDTDLDPVRSREDFKKLVAELEAAAKP
jgi:hypothetical protein